MVLKPLRKAGIYMLVKQLAKQMSGDLNEVFAEIIGDRKDPVTGEVIKGELLKEDLSNYADIGKRIGESEEWTNHYDHYVGKLIDRIGRTEIVNKSLETRGLGLVRNRFEYGALMQKIRVGEIDFKPNPAWELKAGESYPYFDFNPVDMSEKFYDQKETFLCEWSWVHKQLKSAVTSADTITRLYAAIKNKIDIKIDYTTKALEFRSINELNAENIKNGKQINCLYYYMIETGDFTAKAATARTNKAVLQNSVTTIKRFREFIKDPTKFFNNEKELNWTNDSDIRMIMITDYDSAFGVYLESDTYHNEFVKLDGYRAVSSWQGIDETLDYNTRSSISVVPITEGQLPDDFDPETDTDTRLHIETTGIIGCIFDAEAAAIYNEEPETEVAPPNPKGKFTNYYYTWDCSFFIDLAENHLTFVMSDYMPVATEPADWGENLTDYFIYKNGKYENVTADTTFVPNQIFITTVNAAKAYLGVE